MNAPYKPDPELERRLSGRLLDVLIRAGLVLALALLCYRIFSPFLSLMAWALILAVTLFPVASDAGPQHGRQAGACGHAAGAGRHRADRGAHDAC